MKNLTFEQHIRPILKAHCFDCHGEGEKLKGGLDLRLRRLMLKGGESGPAIEPGAPDKSHLVELIVKGEMPKREKKLSPLEIETIKRWIASGAKTARDEPQEMVKGMAITEEERAHWSFQPIRKPTVPKFKAKDRVRTPIDALLLVELARRKLSFSPDADKITLLRRAFFDLIGLPPSPEEAVRFLADTSPEAYEHLIDRLLDSPHYGERWGRHWLDAAGYADSDGYTDADTPREYAYKYRDYVIRSFNADKPFNQFITEQLAGDELAHASFANPQSAIHNPPSLDYLVATGFLRMAADGTATGGIDQDVARNQVIADTIKIVSTSLLGLSVGCAQCHDHRYDPIPQTDYYRLRAVFEPAYDWKNWKTPPQRLISLYDEADKAKAAEVESDARKLAAEKEVKQKQYLEEALEKHLKEKFDEALREPLRNAYQTPTDKRTAEQKKLLADHPSVNINPGVLYQYNQKAADELKAMDTKIAEVRARKPAEDFISVLTEVPGQVPVTHLFHRGDPKQPKDAIRPGGLTILAPPGQKIEFAETNASLPTTGRRLAFARWLTSEQNPLVARVIVNRLWLHHFGRGLVGTPADFGFMGEKPSHPALLDWLADEFETHGWSMKHLHKLIMTSTVYRQSSARVARTSERVQRASATVRAAGKDADRTSQPGNVFSGRSAAVLGRSNVPISNAPKFLGISPMSKPAAPEDGRTPLNRYRQDVGATTFSRGDQIDPDNRLYWRKPIVRLDAEVIRDAILATSGVISPKLFGSTVPVREDAVGQIVVGVDKKEGDTKIPVDVPMGGEEFRRSVYIQVRRSRPLAFLNSFDAPVMEVNCERRQTSTVATQALMLMNSDFILQQAGKFAERLRREAGDDAPPQIARAWQLAFTRPATEKEIHQSLALLAHQTAQLAAAEEKQSAEPGDKGEKKDAKQLPAKKIDPRQQALTNFCQALLSANEFLYVD